MMKRTSPCRSMSLRKNKQIRKEVKTMNIDWKRKLTSRKLWVAIAGFVTGLVLAFNGSADVAETVSGCVMSLGSVVAYIIGEGLTDAANK